MNQPLPRLIRPLPDPLGLYFRPAYGDHRVLLALLAEGRSALTGIVFEPTWDSRHEELCAEINRRTLESVLDTRAMELATPGGFTRGGRSYPGRVIGHTGLPTSRVPAGTEWPTASLNTWPTSGTARYSRPRTTSPARTTRGCKMLRPSTDWLLKALRARLSEDTLKKLENERRKLEGWRYTLGRLSQHRRSETYSTIPQTRASRGRGA